MHLELLIERVYIILMQISYFYAFFSFFYKSFARNSIALIENFLEYDN
jgi:hypothetical protein